MNEMTSCDYARRCWFAQGKTGATAARYEDIEDAILIRHEIASDDMPGQHALRTAHLVECYHGWPMLSGVVLDKEGTPVTRHTWNILPDGGVLDATADLHGKPGAVVMPPGHPDLRHYRREWTPAYNPDLAAQFPELKGASWNGVSDYRRMDNNQDNRPGSPLEA